MEKTRIKETLQESGLFAAEITALTTIYTELEELSPQSQSRVLRYLWDFIREAERREAVLMQHFAQTDAPCDAPSAPPMMAQPFNPFPG